MIMKRTSLLPVLAVALLVATEASAQPQVTWQMIGNQVRIDWTAEPGATLYDINVTGTLSGDITIPTNFAQVAAPAGTYVLRVRGRNGGTVGPYSNPVTIVVGAAAPPPSGCPPVGAPTLTASATGNMANISWSAVAGAVGYRIQVSRTPGGTEVQADVPASQTSYSAAVPMLGTFYVRVLAGNSCGALSPSEEKSFTIGAAAPGPGPGPAPPPSNGVPGPPFPGAVPNLESQVHACRARYPAEFACAHTGASCTRQFIVLCARDMNRLDPFVGLNWKRGAVGSLSEDIIAYRGVGTAVDIVNGGAMEIVDVIFGAGGPNPIVGWNPGPGGPGDRGGWVNPFSINP
jgi:hypothetical protein